MDIAELISTHFDAVDRAGVVSVYLFGSHAEGRAHRESDVDIGILFDRSVVPSKKERFDFSLRISADLRARTNFEGIDVVVLNDAPPLLGRRIITEGRRVVCRDPEIDHAYVRDIQLRAADMMPFLDRMRAIKLEALAPR
jgi:predicted nucleotidyltransferase